MYYMKNLLLFSNSQDYERGYLGHGIEEIKDFLGGINKITFVPYAFFDRDEYTKTVRAFFRMMGIEVLSLHETSDPKMALSETKALFVGGGNTFRLLRDLHELDLIKPIREKILNDMLYIGASAGTIIMCPTIRTTNDMPIVEIPTLDTLSIVPFQINAHYIDADASSRHMGETREKRIEQYHEENDLPVLGLREGTWLRVEDNKIHLGGKKPAKLFLKGKDAEELQPGEILIPQK